MNYVVKNVIKKKLFLVVVIVLSSLIYIAFNMMLKFAYIGLDKPITDNIYFLYYYLFPINYNGQMSTYIIILSFSMIILTIYVLSNIINFFFFDNAVNYLTRINREKFIKKVILINIIFIILIFIIFMIIFSILMMKYKIVIKIKWYIIVPLVIKVLCLILMSLCYLYIFIISNEVFMATMASIFTYFGIEIVINYFMNFTSMQISYDYLFIIFLIICIGLLYFSIIKAFKRRDV